MPYPKPLYESLRTHHVDETVIAEIFAGFEDLLGEGKATKKRTHAFSVRAMDLLDQRLDAETRYQVLDACACSKTGARDRATRKFGKEYAGRSLAEKVEALAQIPNMCKPVLHEDGTITIQFGRPVDQGYRCSCPCVLSDRPAEPISSTYCLCCAGHFRYHYQQALGVPLRTVKVVSTPLNTNGREPCVLKFEVLTQVDDDATTRRRRRS
ncbi:MAG: hypothetical protein ACYC5M_03485 [Anaerolineae bacterium]